TPFPSSTARFTDRDTLCRLNNPNETEAPLGKGGRENAKPHYRPLLLLLFHWLLSLSLFLTEGTWCRVSSLMHGDGERGLFLSEPWPKTLSQRAQLGTARFDSKQLPFTAGNGRAGGGGGKKTSQEGPKYRVPHDTRSSLHHD
ncbi:unnamed protein product, partial [Pleuronectes platessa]